MNPDRKRTLAAVVAAIVVTLVLATVSPTVSAGDPADGKPIPSTRCRGLWIVPLVFGEDPHDFARTMHLVLDTGASTTSVDPDAIERVFGKRVKTGKKVNLRDGEMGPMQVHKIKVKVHEMDHLARALGYEIDGILGFDVFESLLLTLDYHNDEVRVGKGKLGPVDGVEVFEDHGKRRPFIALDLGDRRIPLLLDSGSTGGLDLREEDVDEWLVDPRPVAGSVRYSKIVVVESGRMAGSLGFGPLTIEQPAVELRPSTRLIGAEALERFVLTFDQRNERIRMVPDSDDPIDLRARRGIGAAFHPKSEGFEVIRVFEGLPARQAGLRVGDMVLAIDGLSTTAQSCERAEDDADRTHEQLTIRRGDEEFDVTVEIVELLPETAPENPDER